jgi:hypothetical protein
MADWKINSYTKNEPKLNGQNLNWIESEKKLKQHKHA